VQARAGADEKGKVVDALAAVAVNQIRMDNIDHRSKAESKESASQPRLNQGGSIGMVAALIQRRMPSLRQALISGHRLPSR
jgi:hypothetical protein